jgi:hypothetical protein
MTRQSARRYIPIGVLILAPLAVLGADGQLPLDQLTVASTHHVFHILLPVVAFFVFAVFVAHDISRHGWPAFSWRLTVSPPRPHAVPSVDTDSFGLGLE